MPIAPRALDDGIQSAIRQKVDPFAVRTPIGGEAIVAICGDGDAFAGFDAVDQDLGESICRGGCEGDPTAIGRPADVGKSRIGVVVGIRFGDALVSFAGCVEQVEAIIFVLMYNPFAVGRRNGVPTQHFGAACDLFSRADAVRRVFPRLYFAGFGGKDINRLAIRGKTRFAEAAGKMLADVDKASVFCRRNEDTATRREHDLFAVGREMDGSGVLQRIFDPMLTQMIEV